MSGVEHFGMHSACQAAGLVNALLAWLQVLTKYRGMVAVGTSSGSVHVLMPATKKDPQRGASSYSGWHLINCSGVM